MSGVALILVGGYSFVHTLGIEVQKYECEGSLTYANASTPSTMYLRIELTRLFMPWLDRYGVIRVDAPGLGTFYYSRIDSTPDNVTFSETGLGTGTFDGLGNDLNVPLPEGRQFTGRCRKLN